MCVLVWVWSRNVPECSSQCITIVLIHWFIASRLICITWREVVCLLVAGCKTCRLISWSRDSGLVHVYRVRFYTWPDVLEGSRWMLAGVWRGRSSGDEFQGSDGAQGTTCVEHEKVLEMKRYRTRAWVTSVDLSISALLLQARCWCLIILVEPFWMFPPEKSASKMFCNREVVISGDWGRSRVC